MGRGRGGVMFFALIAAVRVCGRYNYIAAQNVLLYKLIGEYFWDRDRLAGYVLYFRSLGNVVCPLYQSPPTQSAIRKFSIMPLAKTNHLKFNSAFFRIGI